VDRAVSPISIHPDHPSPFPSQSPSSNSLTDFKTAWIDPTHFHGTPFYMDPLKVAFIDLPAIIPDSGLCTNLHIHEKWKQTFLKKNLISKFFHSEDPPQTTVWEWVSYQPPKTLLFK
jgi:hypothetical protein